MDSACGWESSARLADFDGNKKVPGAETASRTNVLSTPWYHLGSHSSSRSRPFRVPTHSRAVTCAHVATYAGAVGCATPRPCSADPSVLLCTDRSSLCRICLRTLLFIVFFCELVCLTRSLTVLTAFVNRKMQQIRKTMAEHSHSRLFQIKKPAQKTEKSVTGRGILSGLDCKQSEKLVS